MKYLQIGRKIIDKKLPYTQLEEIKNSLYTTEDFIDFCSDYKNWTYNEHDELKAILDTPKNQNGYYKDLYGQRVSYNGNRTLKKSHTEIYLSIIHKNEIQKCKEDFKYFRKYYCLIKTKDGLSRPEVRKYQEDLEDALLSKEDISVSWSRQAGKTIFVGVYLSWLFLFHPESLNMGIVANRPKTAWEVLDKIKKILAEVPIWMQRGVEIWNRGEIESDKGTRIMTDSAGESSFRGFTCAVIFVDEVAYIPVNDWQDFQDSVIPTMSSLKFKQLIYTSTAYGMNHWAEIVDNSKIKIQENIAKVKGTEVIEIDGNIITVEDYYDKNNK